MSVPYIPCNMYFLVFFSIITVFTVPSNCWQYNYRDGGTCDDTNSYLVVDTEISAGSGSFRRYETIRYEAVEYVKCVDAENLWRDNTGGEVLRIDGGVGQKFIKLEFKTQLSRGMKFRLRIWEPKPKH